MQVRKAVIPAAGLGTRFLPATKAQPKEMLPIVDKPTLQYIIEEAVDSGIEEILIITGRNKTSSKLRGVSLPLAKVPGTTPQRYRVPPDFCRRLR